MHRVHDIVASGRPIALVVNLHLASADVLLPDAAGGANIGSAPLPWGDVYIADDKKIQFGDAQDATIEYDEDGDDVIFSVTPIDFDPDDNLTVGYVNSNSSLFESISLDIIDGGSEEVRTFTLNPADNQYGSSTFIVTVSDGIFTTTKQTTLTVNSINDAPELVEILDQNIDEDNTFTYELFANDIEGDTLEFSSNVISSRSGTLSLNDNTLTFVPTEHFFGDVNINVSVSDGEYSDSDTFVLSINSINDNPDITSEAELSGYTLPGPGLTGETYSYQLETSDVDDSSFNYEFLSSPSGMEISSSGLICLVACHMLPAYSTIS